MLPAYLTQDARELIRRLMKRSETQRLGAAGAQAVRGHAFFKHVHWDDVFARRLEPPIKPRLVCIFLIQRMYECCPSVCQFSMDSLGRDN